MERKVDELGRVVIPMEIRKVLGWTPGTRLKLERKGEVVVLKKSEGCCSFCGGVQDLKEVKGVRVCEKCITDIKQGKFFSID